MKIYEIKITGSGTKEEIVKALLAIASNIEPGQLEDSTLFTVITPHENQNK